jgi:hypothetical protein
VRNVALAVTTVPPVLTFVAWLVMLSVAGITGRHPIWNVAPKNLAEAAAFRDPVAVVRYANRGEAIDRAAPVRNGIVGTADANLTPIEAAAAAQDATMVHMLFSLGAAPDARVWQRAWCSSDTPEVREALERKRPAGSTPAPCP